MLTHFDLPEGRDVRRLLTAAWLLALLLLAPAISMAEEGGQVGGLSAMQTDTAPSQTEGQLPASKEGEGRAAGDSSPSESPGAPSVAEVSTPEPEPEPDPVPPVRKLVNGVYLPPEIEQIKERGVLVVGQFKGFRDGFFMPGGAPHLEGLPSINDDRDGTVVGYDIEIAQRIADRLGVRLELRRDQESFNGICKSVNRGDVDLGISKLTVTLGRSLYVNFSQPYVTLGIGVLINRLRELRLGESESDPYIVLNREGATIAVQAGTSWVQFGRDLFPKAELVEFPTMDDALAAVIAGETVGFLNDEWNISVALNERPEITLRARLAFLSDVRSSIAIAVAPEARHLLSFINQMIESDRLTTTPDHLLQRYFDQSAARRMVNAREMAEKEEAPRAGLKWELVAASALLLIAMILWLQLAMRGQRNLIDDGEAVEQ